MTTEEHFDADHIHTTPEGRHFRHGDGVEVDGEGQPLWDEHGNVPAIDAALRGYATTHDNPCGGCGYFDAGEKKPWRVLFADGAACESFATLAEAVEAAEDYADEMDAEGE